MPLHNYMCIQAYICASKEQYLCMCIRRTRSFLEAGFRPPYPSFVLFVSLIKTGTLVQYQNMLQVSAARSFLVAGSTPAGFQEGFCAAYTHIQRLENLGILSCRLPKLLGCQDSLRIEPNFYRALLHTVYTYITELQLKVGCHCRLFKLTLA